MLRGRISQLTVKWTTQGCRSPGLVTHSSASGPHTLDVIAPGTVFDSFRFQEDLLEHPARGVFK